MRYLTWIILVYMLIGCEQRYTYHLPVHPLGVVDNLCPEETREERYLEYVEIRNHNCTKSLLCVKYTSTYVAVCRTKTGIETQYRLLVSFGSSSSGGPYRYGIQPSAIEGGK